MQLFEHRAKLLHTAAGQDLIDRFGHPILSILRSTLIQVLVDHLGKDNVALGMRCKSVRQDGDSVYAAFDDHDDIAGSFLIAADGLRSALRTQLYPNTTLRYSGETCWRGLSRNPLPDRFARTSVECWGVGSRFGFSPVTDELVYWWATRKTAAGETDDDNLKGELLRLFGHFMAPIPAILDGTPVPSIIRRDLYDVPHVTGWGSGRIILLGDAAHAPTPNLGQGGAQAIEDAWALAQCLKSDSQIPTAFRRYAAIRIPRARRIVKKSWRFGRVAGLENRIARAARDFLIRTVPESVSRRQMDWIFMIDERVL